jgi:Ca2+-binding RTX toxin-like protein
VNRFAPMLVAAACAAVVLPQTVGAQSAAIDHPLGLDLAGNVDLSVANVTTGGVEITTPTTASLTATVDPNSLGTTYYFEYGSNGNLNLRTPAVSLGGQLDPKQVVADLTGLTPGVLYDYRIVTSGPAGLSVGATQSFQTSAASAPGAAKKGKKSRCTIQGTRKKDVLRGTRKRDVICGLGGNDRIRGLGGNDVIRGGPGKDRVLAGKGKDRVWGDSGNDSLYGQQGADQLFGGKGRDQVVGGSGRDSAKIDRRDKVRSVEKTSRR